MTVMMSALTFAGVIWWATPIIHAHRPELSKLASVVIARLTYYPSCRAARAAGVTPLHRGTPGYRTGLDADGDGIACEPYRGSQAAHPMLEMISRYTGAGEGNPP